MKKVTMKKINTEAKEFLETVIEIAKREDLLSIKFKIVTRKFSFQGGWEGGKEHNANE